MEFPISEADYQHPSDYNSNAGKTTFPDSSFHDMADWTARVHIGKDAWVAAMNVGVAYTRFDGAIQYLKNKLFKIKAPVELHGGRVNENWS